VALTLGARDPRTGAFAVNNGLDDGDSVLRYPSSTLKDGQPAKLAQNDSATQVVAEK
jgi:hypothetical protein